MEKMLRITDIRRDIELQPRAQMNLVTLAEYQAALEDGEEFPPVVVFKDQEGKFWLADGFHRIMAAERVGKCKGVIRAELIKGEKRDAVLYSVGANATHGLRRTNADKRKAVETLLRDVIWARWSDREIARKCAVSHALVSNMRIQLSVNDGQIGGTQRVVKRNGKAFVMETARIGEQDGENERVATVQEEYFSPAPQESQSTHYDQESHTWKVGAPVTPPSPPPAPPTVVYIDENKDTQPRSTSLVPPPPPPVKAPVVAPPPPPAPPTVERAMILTARVEPGPGLVADRPVIVSIGEENAGPRGFRRGTVIGLLGLVSELLTVVYGDEHNGQPGDERLISVGTPVAWGSERYQCGVLKSYTGNLERAFIQTADELVERDVSEIYLLEQEA